MQLKDRVLDVKNRGVSRWLPAGWVSVTRSDRYLTTKRPIIIYAGIQDMVRVGHELTAARPCLRSLALAETTCKAEHAMERSE